MALLFWLFIGLILYCYFGYPAVLAVLARLCPRPVKKARYPASVSFVLSAYNEEDVIARKIENLLSLDYPDTTPSHSEPLACHSEPEGRRISNSPAAPSVEILIGSDGSSDRTDEIIRSFSDPRIKFFPGSERRGKMATINDLVAKAQNEIVVFTDARQIFARDAVVQLVDNFADPKVGCVSGELMLSSKEGVTAKGINLYWNYEKFIRRCEAELHSMMGATGAIYALRRALYSPVPRDVVLDDMYTPFMFIRRGFRAYFDPEAKAYDEVADSPKEEHRRKARTLYGNYQIFGIFPDLFIPFKSPIAVQLFSHKFLRVVAPFVLIAIFLLNLLLLGQGIYQTIFVLQVLFYAMAVTGAALRYHDQGVLRVISRICYVPYVFCLMNFSALSGFIRFLSGAQEVTWEKARAGR